uniref:Post-GPI attachment to proteins factor 3 n=1 Tax=Schistosoma mansoni TaxID=6183 RepID=A0A146MJ08_SCHMA
MVFMLLELCDFVPIGWIFDSHALWHASSLLIIIPWYNLLLVIVFIYWDKLLQK